MKSFQQSPSTVQPDRQPLETPTQRKMHRAPRQGDFHPEHYHGERQLDIDELPGDIEEETLDKDAPFNKSYGLK